MPSSMSKLIVANSRVSLKSIDKSFLFDPISKLSFLKNTNSSWNLHGKRCRSLQYYLINRPMDKRMMFVTRSNVNPPPTGVPISSGSPPGPLRNWIVGIVLTFVLPFLTHKAGSFVLLKNRIETMEHTIKAIENMAVRVDTVIDTITDSLPDGSTLKTALVAADKIVEEVAKTAHIADDILNKVEKSGKLESLVHEKGEKTAIEDKSNEGQEISAKDQENDQ